MDINEPLTWPLIKHVQRLIIYDHIRIYGTRTLAFKACQRHFVLDICGTKIITIQGIYIF